MLCIRGKCAVCHVVCVFFVSFVEGPAAEDLRKQATIKHLEIYVFVLWTWLGRPVGATG